MVKARLTPGPLHAQAALAAGSLEPASSPGRSCRTLTAGNAAKRGTRRPSLAAISPRVTVRYESFGKINDFLALIRLSASYKEVLFFDRLTSMFLVSNGDRVTGQDTRLGLEDSKEGISVDGGACICGEKHTVTDQEDKPPRPPVTLREKLRFRKAGARTEREKHAGRSSFAVAPDIKSSRPAARDDFLAPGAEQSTQGLGPEIPLGIQLPDGDQQVGRTGEIFDNDQFWTAETAVPLDGPKGPDYTSFDPVMSGLVNQAERYRRQWRNKHNKDPEAAPVVASQKTQELYETCGRRLSARYIRTEAHGMAVEDMDPRDFVNWLLARKPFWDDSTWRMNRAGAIVAVHTIPSAFGREALAWLYSDLQTGSDSRARGRANQIEQRQLEKLKIAVRESNSRPARWLEIWLDAGIYTGLHPAEWPLATLETHHDTSAPFGRRVWLHVLMGHVECKWLTHRTLEISKFSEAAVTTVRLMINSAREWAIEGKFAARQGEVARLLRETSKNCGFKLQYDLHSVRQQFIENMRSQYSDAEVAALAGHLCVNNGRKHYTKRRAAWTEIAQIPVPSQQWVARMQKRLDMYLTKQELINNKAAYRLAVMERLDDSLAE